MEGVSVGEGVGERVRVGTRVGEGVSVVEANVGVTTVKVAVLASKRAADNKLVEVGEAFPASRRVRQDREANKKGNSATNRRTRGGISIAA
jgi:hypothetical protein